MRASKADGKGDLDVFLEELSRTSTSRDLPGPLRLVARLARGGARNSGAGEGGRWSVSSPPMDAGVTKGTTFWF